MAGPALAPVVLHPGERRPLVSIVMPTYRRAHLIGESIGSLLRQSFGDFELLVQDDASPDDTAAVVAAIGDARIRYARNASNVKMPGNLNAGIARATGVYVLVCHDHDLYASTLVEEMLGVLRQDPALAYVHTGLAVIGQDGRPAGRTFVADYPAQSDGKDWLRYMLSRFDSPVCANTMVPRRRYEEVTLYDPSFGFVSDIEMWMRLALVGDVAYLAKPLIQVREREPGHEFFSTRWDVTDTVIRMHRFYHGRVFGGAWRSLQFQARVEAHLLRGYLSALKHRDWEERRRAGAYFRRSPTLLCRAVGHLG
jgi:glycosyltransferase involved in cell wall biosynthesis